MFLLHDLILFKNGMIGVNMLINLSYFFVQNIDILDQTVVATLEFFQNVMSCGLLAEDFVISANYFVLGLEILMECVVVRSKVFNIFHNICF